jgi:hypothetical protein
MLHETRRLARAKPRLRALMTWPIAIAAVAMISDGARAQITAYQATIDQSQETPPTGSPAAGSGIFTFNQSTNMMNYSISFSGLTSAEIAAHIHQGALGVAGGVIVPLPLGSPISGSVAIPAAQVANVLSGNTYCNFHTQVFQGGEIRGQIIPPPSAGTSFCDPGVGNTIPCPCGNPPAGPGHGCDNSSATGGAVLKAQGNPSLAADTLVFTTTGEKPSATSILLQGDNVSATGVPFGQGVRCVAGALKRLYTKTASGGSIAAPDVTDVRVAARSAALGDNIPAGGVRNYMVYYRDPTVLGGCPASSTFNGTQAIAITWGP